jgi:hypothetical protein
MLSKTSELYSARKYRTKGVALSSVINPATISLSASGRSKGVRADSARAAMRYKGTTGEVPKRPHLSSLK